MDERIDGGPRDLRRLDDGSSPAEGERSIPPDRALSAVADDHRRAVLDSLTSAPGETLDYDVLVGRVADRVRDEAVERGSGEHRQRVRIALYHTHLPKLEAIRVLDYEAETGHVRLVDGELARELLTMVESYAVPV